MKRKEALGFFLLVALPATQVAAQPTGSADSPPGVERPYVVPSFIDVPPAGLGVMASASGELPPLPDWCDGTCVIDIAFFYAPEAIGQTNGDVFGSDHFNPEGPHGPQTLGQLRARLRDHRGTRYLVDARQRPALQGRAERRHDRSLSANSGQGVIEDLAQGGGTVEYRHNGGGVIVGDNGYSTALGVISDTSAFPCGRSVAQAGKGRQSAGGPAGHAAAGYGQHSAAAIVTARDARDTRDYGCPGEACLNNWRFRVDANFVDREACDTTAAAGSPAATATRRRRV